MLRHVLRLTAVVCGLLLANSLSAKEPATRETRVSDTNKAESPLDLRKFPVMPDASLQQQNLTNLSYEAPSSVRDAFEFQQQQLTKLRWNKLDGSYESDANCSAAFERDGFKLSVSVYSAGTDGNVSVMLIQHGNVDLQKLPLPQDLKLFYGGPASSSYLTETSVDETKAACLRLLVQDGWEPYGVAGDSLMFRKQATRLTAFISAAPAQGGKTMAQFSSELLGAQIPLFPGSTNAQYSDNPTQLFFDSGKSMDEVVAFYRATLAGSGWKPTMDKLIQVSIYDVMIFRNPVGDMMELQLHEFEGQARGLLRYSTAEEVAKLEALAKQKADEELKRRDAPKQVEQLSVKIPAEAKQVEVTSHSIEFQMPAGRARAVVDQWRKEFVKAGWKEEAAVLQGPAGAVSLAHDSQSLTLTYTDVGFMPAEISIDAIGVELVRAPDESKNK